MSKRLRAVVYRDGDWWIAVCLEYGVATQARGREQIGPELQRALQVQIRASRKHGIEPFAGLSEAPDRYWRMFEARGVTAPELYELPEGFSVEAYEAARRVHAIA